MQSPHHPCSFVVYYYQSDSLNVSLISTWLFSDLFNLKALANEDTLLRTRCCRHKCFPVCPRAQHLLRTQILCPRHKNVSDFVQKHFVSATNVSQFAQPKKHHGQQCVRNNVSSFTRALMHAWLVFCSQTDSFFTNIFTNCVVYSLNLSVQNFTI